MEQRLSRALIGLADTLVADFAIVDLARRLCQHSVELLPIEAAMVLLAGSDGHLQVAASAPDDVMTLEPVEHETGPCISCLEATEPVADLDAAGWPQYRAALHQAGFEGCVAVPLRLREQVLGALALLSSARLELCDADTRRAHALCDAATVGLLQDRSRSRLTTLSEQLQTALESRLLIEQAKGILAERAGIGLEAAFQMIRTQARSTHQSLAEIATSVINGTLNDPALQSQ